MSVYSGSPPYRLVKATSGFKSNTLVLDTKLDRLLEP